MNPRAARCTGSLITGVLLALLALGGWWRLWSVRPTPIRQQQLLMGTLVELTIPVPREADRGRLEQAGRKALAAMAEFAARVDTWAATGEVDRLNRHAGDGVWLPLSAEVMEELRLCRQLSALSGGAFDSTVGPLVEFWCEQVPHQGWWPDLDELREVRKRVNWRAMELDESAGTARLRQPGMALDLGGIAKGRGVDLAVAALRTAGVTSALVNAGGNVYALGTKPDGGPWRIGIRHPRQLEHLLARLSLTDQAVATSGDYEQVWEVAGRRYSHLLDPRSGYPAMACASVTILCGSAEYADGLSTAIFVLGPTEGLQLAEQLPDVEALIADASLNISMTPGLSAHWLPME